MRFDEMKKGTLVRVLFRPTWGICRVVDKTTNGVVCVEEVEAPRIRRHFRNGRWLKPVETQNAE